jgi:pimeloyl-ACP methyl ester carboxylesterase/tetratricopeptide (TPR) repeat protein
MLVSKTLLTVGVALIALPELIARPAAAPTTSIAPELSGLGTDHLPVTTRVPKAQAFFDQGLRLLYAFNHQESRRAFQQAARLDPSLAMAHWGQAMTLAPNLNAPMTAESARLAKAATREAVRLSAGADAMERALIDALARRFAVNSAAPRAPLLDQAYAEAMARVAADFPFEPNVQTLYADAVMNTMPWDYWQKDGTPKPATSTLMATLEDVLARHPYHAGANHYYIHLIEASPTPERAEASADRLGSLMPAAGHMVHMPAHIYLRVGRYADAAEANVRAIAADEDYLAQCQAQGLYPVSYYPHNLHFLWAAATLEGRSATAIDAARKVAEKVPHHHAGAVAWTADFPVTPWLAYVRFGRWQQMLIEPKPPEKEPYAIGIWHYGRALAFVARNQAPRAQAELDALTAVMGHRAFTTTLKDLPLLTNLQLASRIVRGEIAAHAGRHDEAVAVLREAVAIEDALPYNEPPVWHQPTRQVLGALLLEAGRAGEAEVVYRQDLARVRENGWSLFGLSRSLQAQGKAAEAAAAQSRFEKAWARADFTLTSSRVLADAGPAPSTPTHKSHAAHAALMEAPHAWNRNAARDADTVPTVAPHGGSGAPRAPKETGTSQVSAGISGGTANWLVHSIALPTGVTLQYAEHGSQTGVPVIFLHGVSDSWQSFKHVLPLLPPTIRAIALTARGHGDSSRPATGYSYRDMAEDVRAFMNAMELPAAVVVGHSMGASVAQRLAIDHPSRVAGLVLVGAFATMQRHAELQAFYEKDLVTLTDPIDPGFAREFQVSTLARELPAEQLDTFVRESQKMPARVWKEAFKGFLDTPCFCRELNTLTMPTLIIWGDRDAYTVRAQQDTLHSEIRGSRLLVYHGTGHAVHWEEPRRFVNDVVSFVYQRR